MKHGLRMTHALWIAANALAWAGGACAAVLLDLSAAGSAIFGVLVAAGQWLVLRAALDRPGWWFAATAAGAFAGMLVGNIYGFFSPDPFWMGGTGGFLSGLLQWLVLRRSGLGRIVWPLASLAGWIGGCIAGTAAAASAYSRLTTNEALYFALGGAVAGLVVGTVSAPFLPRPVPRPVPRDDARPEPPGEPGAYDAT